MTKNIDYIEMESACNHLWVTTEEIKYILGGCSKTKADNFRKEVEKKLKEEKTLAMLETNDTKKNKLLANCFYYEDTKPHRLPIKRVLEFAHVDLDFVRREANKMRKANLIENKGGEKIENVQ